MDMAMGMGMEFMQVPTWEEMAAGRAVGMKKKLSKT